MCKGFTSFSGFFIIPEKYIPSGWDLIAGLRASYEEKSVFARIISGQGFNKEKMKK
jgi:hypothetical protein